MATLLSEMGSRFPSCELHVLVSRFHERQVREAVFQRRYVHPFPTSRFRILEMKEHLRDALRSEAFDAVILPTGDRHGDYCLNYKVLLLGVRAKSLYFYFHGTGFRRISRVCLVFDILASLARRVPRWAAMQLDVFLFLALVLFAFCFSRLRGGLGAVKTNGKNPHGPLPIAFFITSIDLGGAQRQLLYLGQHLSRNEFRPTMIPWFIGDKFYEPQYRAKGLALDFIRKTGGLHSLAVLRLYGKLRKTRPLILHNWLFMANMVGSVAGTLAGVPYIISSVRNMNVWKTTWYRKWWYRFADRLCARMNRKVIGNSQAVSEDTARWLGLPADRILTVANGIDPASVPFLTERELDEKKSLVGLHPGMRLVSIFGRLAIEKDHVTFFRAFKRVSERVPEAHALVVGSGELEEELVSHCLENGLGDKVTFLGSRPDVHAWMQMSDCVVQTSIIEGMPNVLMEALLLGRPVVATDAGGTREIILHGKTGMLVPVGDVDSVAAAVEQILRDGRLARTLGENGRQHIKDSFGVTRMVESLQDIYRRAAGGTL
jgi:glycosyltransferase involved in cell wall biosynthesis